MATFTIPTTTLSNGTYHFPTTGGEPIPDTDTDITVLIDRTVPNGLNSLTASARIDGIAEQSDDGGTTWFQTADFHDIGGIYINKATGTTRTTTSLDDSLIEGTNRQVRTTITISGGPIALGGTVKTS